MRRRTGRGRWPWLVLGGLACLGAGAVAVRWLNAWPLERPLDGPLAGRAAPVQLKAGEFTVAWTGQMLRVTRGEREVLSTLPGRAFVGAARGDGGVRESRGLFSLNDRRVAGFAAQRVDAVRAGADGVTISGSLGGQVPYTLTLRSVGHDQLSVGLQLTSPQVNRAFLTLASGTDEHFFGFGEQFSSLDLKGRRLPVLTSENGVGRGQQPVTLAADLTAGAGGRWFHSYAAMPWTLTTRGRGLWLSGHAVSVWDLRRADRVQVQAWTRDLTVQVAVGDSPSALLATFTAANGRMRPLPDWIGQGAVVGLQGGTERVRRVYRSLKAAGVPISALWLQDWVGPRSTSFGQQLWWNWALDRAQYPAWEQLVADLRRDGVRVLGYVNPMLVQRPGAAPDLYGEAVRHGYLVKGTDGSPYPIQNTSFSAGLVDLTNPAAYDWLKGVLREQLLAAGFSGWMADFGEALPFDAVLWNGMRGEAAHNLYPELWARLNRELIEESPQGAELVAFHRSAFTGSPGSATLFWTGDQLVDWGSDDGLASALTALLSGGLSGMTLNHSDAGGYTTIVNLLLHVQRSPELLERWSELAAFTAVLRTHEGNRPAANAQISDTPASRAHFARMARLYRALAPYRRDLMREAATRGLPLVRPLWLEYPGDPQTTGLKTEFLLGRDLLVAPVLRPGATRVRAYLPAGRWTHLWTGQTLGDASRGAWTEVPAPIGQPAVFYRAESEMGLRLETKLKAEGLLR